MSLAKDFVGGKRKQGEDVDSMACPEAVATKPRKTTMRAWLVEVSCNSKEDISCLDLQMHDPFQQLKASYFGHGVMIQQFLVRNKQKSSKKKFAHGAFGPCILYYAGTVSGAPCVDMESVDTIDSLIKRLAASN